MAFGELRLLLRRRLGLVSGFPLGIGHAVDDLARLLVGEIQAALRGAARYHFDRQLRQKPARFMRSMFCTSGWARKCSTSVRNAAASSSVRVRSSRSAKSAMTFVFPLP